MLASLFLLLGYPALAASPQFQPRFEAAVTTPAPGLPGMHLVSIQEVATNSRGDLLFTAPVARPATPAYTDSVQAVFLRRDGETQLLMKSGDIVGGQEFRPSGRVVVALTDQGRPVIAHSRELLTLLEGEWVRLAQAGQPIQLRGGQTEIVESLFFADDFLNRANQIGYAAEFANGRQAAFQVVSGSSTPLGISGETVEGVGRIERVFAPQSCGTGWVVTAAPRSFRAGALFRYRDLAASLVATTGESEGPRAVNSVASTVCDADDQLIVAVQRGRESDPAILAHTPQGLIPIIEKAPFLRQRLGEEPTRFSNLRVASNGRLFFTAEYPAKGGFFFWDGVNIIAAVVDGDPSPDGGNLIVTNYPFYTPIPLPDLSRFYSGFAVDDYGRIAFQNLEDDAILLWDDGRFERFAVPRLDSFAGDPDNAARVESIVFVTEDRLLMRLSLCCRAGRSLVSYSLVPGNIFLPYLVTGGSNLSYQTRIELRNRGEVPTAVRLHIRSRQVEVAEPMDLMLEPGVVQQLNLDGDVLESGFLQLEVPDRLPVEFNGLIRLRNQQDLISQTTVQTQTPSDSFGLVVERRGSARTGVAISNPNSENGIFQASLTDSLGNEIANSMHELAPDGQLRVFFDELFEGLGPGDILGFLSISANQPLLMTGLRLAGLQLSTMPVLDGPLMPLDWAFHNRLPLDTERRVGDFLSAPNQTFAVVIDSGLIFRVRRGLRAEVLNLATSMPGNPDMASVRLFALNEAGDLLIGARQDNGSNVLYTWRGTEVRQLVTEGNLVDGEALEFVLDPKLVQLASNGDVLVGGSGLVRLGESNTRLLSGEERPGGNLICLDEAANGDIIFVTDELLGRHNGESAEVVIDFGASAQSEGLARVLEIVANGEGFYYLAEGLPQFGSPQEIRYHDGQQSHTLVGTGDEAGTMSPSQVTSFVQPLRRNSSGQLFALAELIETGPEGSAGAAIFRLDGSDPAELILSDRDTDPPFLVDVERPFFLSEDGTLLFATLGGANSVHLWSDSSGIQQVAHEGNAIAVQRTFGPIYAESIQQLLGWSAAGEPVLLMSTLSETGMGLYFGRRNGGQRQVIPQIVVGNFGQLVSTTELLLFNPNPHPVSVRVSIFPDVGEARNAVEGLELPARGSVRVALESPANLIGWARVDSQGGAVETFARITLSQGNSLVSELTVPSAELLGAADFSGLVQPDEGADTGLAVVNPYPMPITIALTLEIPGSGVVLETELQLGIYGHQASFVSQIFELVRADEPVVFTLRSNVRLPVLALRQENLRLSVQAPNP